MTGEVVAGIGGQQVAFSQSRQADCQAHFAVLMIEALLNPPFFNPVLSSWTSSTACALEDPGSCLT